MCNPALAMMAAGTAMQYLSQQQAIARANSEMSRVQDRNDEYNRQIIDVVNQNAEQYDPSRRQAAMDTAQQDAVASLTGYLARARDAGMGEVSAATQGRTSEAFGTERARRVAEQADVAQKLAQLMGRVRGPVDLRTEEAFTNADAASRIGLLGQEQIAMGRAGMYDVGRAGQPDPLLMTAGGALAGYGAGKAMYGGTTTPGTSSEPVAMSSYGPIYGSRRGPVIPRSLFKG